MHGAETNVNGALLMVQAIEDFTSVINIDVTCMEAWKRRGQSKAALGQDAEAILDLTHAAELAPKDSDVMHQRGLVYFKLVRMNRWPQNSRAFRLTWHSAQLHTSPR